MKTTIVILFCILSVFAFCQAPSNGLVGAWLFSGNASDAVGGNNGTVVGATLVPDRCGNPGSAYSFNGTSNYIQMLSAGPSGSASRSLSFWAKTANVAPTFPRASFDYGSFSGTGTCFEIVWNYCAAGVGLNVSNQALIRNNSCMLNNTWHHIAVVYNSTVSAVYSSVDFYVDGVLQSGITCNITGTNAAINTGTTFPITIGRSADGIGKYWSGTLDDFYLYNRPLSQAEVLQLYSTCATPVSGNTLVCPGSVNIYTVPPITNATYTWTLPNGWTGTSTTNTISTVAVGSGVISVVASSTCGSFPTSTIAVTVGAFVSNLVSANISCVSPGSATATVDGAGPFSYTWMPGAQNASVATNLIPGLYTLTVVDNGSGCSTTTPLNFNSLVPFSGTISSTPSLLCNGLNNGSAGIALSGGSGSQTYTWTDAGGPQTSPVATGLSAGIHTVTVIDAVTSCTIIQTFQITQPPPTGVSISAASPSACVGSSIILTATGLGGQPGYTYTWVPGPLTASSAVTQTLNGTYVYSVICHDAAGCPSSNSITVFFVSYPVLSVSNVSICIGNTATLSASGASSFTWQAGGFTGNSINVTPGVTSSYTVYGNTAGCTSNSMVSVIVNPLPIPGITCNNNICEGMPLNLNASGAGNYAWSGPNGFSSTSANPVVTTSLSSAGGYSLTVTDGNGCSASIATLVAVLANPLPAAAGATVCIGESATLTASGGVSYSWAGPAGYSANGATVVILQVSSSSAGNYIVNVTGSTSCVSSTVVQLLANAYPLPSPTIVSMPKACLHSTIALQAFGGVSYTWGGPRNFYSVSPILNFTADSLSQAGIYTLTARNASNCSASTTVQVTLFPLPNSGLIASRYQGCVPFCTEVRLKPSPANIAPIKGFYFSSGPGYFSDSTLTSCLQFPGDATLQVNYVDTNGCVNTASVMVTAHSKPIADFDFYPPLPYANTDLVQFNNQSLGQELNNWTWYFGDDALPVNEVSTAHKFLDQGKFPVALVVKNSYGCWDTVVKIITVSDDLSLYVPNAFTPNGDGLNDSFEPKGVGVTNYQLDIYDRWGIKVFSTSSINETWDGSHSGKTCIAGAYAWTIKVSDLRGKVTGYDGSVTLVR